MSYADRQQRNRELSKQNFVKRYNPADDVMAALDQIEDETFARGIKKADVDLRRQMEGRRGEEAAAKAKAVEAKAAQAAEELGIKQSAEARAQSESDRKALEQRRKDAIAAGGAAMAGGLSKSDLDARAAEVGMEPAALLAAIDQIEADRLSTEAKEKASAEAKARAQREQERHNLATEAGSRDEAAARREEARALREIARSQKIEDRTFAVDEKKKNAVLEVEGFRSNIQDNIKNLKKQIEETGTFELTGPEGANMERWITGIATDLAKLADPGSVAREGEVALQKKGLFETGFGALKTRNATAQQVLDALAKEVDKRVDNAYRIRGLKAPGEQQVPAPAAAPRPRGAATASPAADDDFDSFMGAP